jgi:hypothetical protein
LLTPSIYIPVGGAGAVTEEWSCLTAIVLISLVYVFIGYTIVGKNCCAQIPKFYSPWV